MNLNDSLELYGVRGQNAVATPLFLLTPGAVAVTKRFVQSESADRSPSPWGTTDREEFVSCGATESWRAWDLTLRIGNLNWGNILEASLGTQPIGPG